MKRNLLIIFICIGSLYISFKVGYEIGNQKSADAPAEILVQGFMATTAYTASLSLSTEINNHQFIKSGHYAVAEQFSVDRINILIEQIEGINYSDAPFKDEIDTNLFVAKTYLENLTGKK